MDLAGNNRVAHRWMGVFLASGLFWVMTSLGADSTQVPHYQEGEIVESDITTPIRLVVIDREATDQKRESVARQVPPVFRYDIKVEAEVEEEFLTVFSGSRARFMLAVRSVFPDGLPESGMEAEAFRTIVDQFHQAAEWSTFPRHESLYRLWAEGKSDRPIETEWAGYLKEAMRDYVRAIELPVEVGDQSGKVTIVYAGEEVEVSLKALKESQSSVGRAELYSLSRARAELRSRLSEDQVGRFLAGFLRENCWADEELTNRMRADRVRNTWVRKTFERGEMIVGKGETVDSRDLEVLEALRGALLERSLNASPQFEGEVEGSEAGFLLGFLQRDSVWKLVAGGCGGVLMILFVGWWRGRRRSRRSDVAALSSVADVEMNLSCPACHEPIALLTGEQLRSLSQGGKAGESALEIEQWRERALAAERKIGEAKEVVKKGLLPHIASRMVNRFVRGVVQDREQLLENERIAVKDVEDLEARLSRLQAPLQERLRVYEKRIENLENQLSEKSLENEELLRIKIEAARRQLKREQEKNDISFS